MSYTAPVSAFAPFYGGVAYFAEDGTTVEATSVAVDAKPPGSVMTTWEALSCIELASVGHEIEGGERRKCFNATTGLYEFKQSDGRRVRQYYEFTVQQVTEFLLRIAHNVATIDADGAGVPNSQAQALYRGWLKVQQQNGTEVVTVAELWGELTMPNAMQIAGDSAAIPQLRFDVIANSLNAIQFGTDTA